MIVLLTGNVIDRAISGEMSGEIGGEIQHTMDQEKTHFVQFIS